jgi:flagellar basal-body rod protein FlgB
MARTMIDKLHSALHAQSEALVLRARRQQVIASNIANADTPGYKAVDFDFARALQAAIREPGRAHAPKLQPQPAAQPAADANTVEMDVERARFADNAVRYEAALRTLNGQIRTLLDAIRG